MKAVVLDTDDRFHLIDAERPVPGPGQVAIAVQYAGIQWGDVLVRRGHFPVPRPFVAGFEAAGQVVGVGPGVDGALLGRTVTALTSGGAFAEVLTASAALTFDAEGLAPRTAAAVGWTTPTAYDLIHTVTRVRSGDRVLVHAAAGGVGTMAAQFARAAGAGRVVGVVGDAERAVYAARFGYDRLITRAEFADASDGHAGEEPFDVILDPVGGSTRLAGLQRLAPHGRLAMYGTLAGSAPVVLDTDELLMSGRSVLSYNSDLLSRTHPERLADSARHALRAMTQGDVRPDITAEYEMADIEEALERLAEGKTYGKSILRVAPHLA
ncbi:quinone oxidoreductase family protein [Streptomyces cyanogenus]|uniref:Mycocerosic acid synthase n=1 Tax=Streptomyces cyanogenus TaxID=80860 RepID=A0ABX7U5Z5_STRCY|nr:zinc-binding alcohol dehydrogenase family protein [Streptomyces cyanogenus]QTE02991.1 Mycocerosic acid synthase [Streptomyces cyanogenus]